MTRKMTLPILGLGVAAVKTSVDFNKGMANVATLAGHSNTAITAGYVRHNMADLARAAVVLAAAG